MTAIGCNEVSTHNSVIAARVRAPIGFSLAPLVAATNDDNSMREIEAKVGVGLATRCESGARLENTTAAKKQRHVVYNACMVCRERMRIKRREGRGDRLLSLLPGSLHSHTRIISLGASIYRVLSFFYPSR